MTRTRLALALALGLASSAILGCDDSAVEERDAEPTDAPSHRDGGRDASAESADGGGARTDGGAPLFFVDVAAEAGLTESQSASGSCLLRFSGICEHVQMTGGAAVGDADGDGIDDIYLTRLDAPGVLYRNRGDGTFEDATARFELDRLNAPSNGAAFFDSDDDGDLDLYVTTFDPTGMAPGHHFHLFVNRGGRFVDEAVERNAAVLDDAPRAGVSIAVGDYDLDGHADLHVNEWLDRGVPHAGHTRLLHNLGASAPGTFEDATITAGVAENPLGCEATADRCDVVAFASAIADLDADGLPDLLVAGDFGRSRLYFNRGDGTFEDRTVAAGVGTDENGMGSTLGDYDGDGDLDWFVTAIGDPFESCGEDLCTWGYSGNRLFRNEGERTFTDATDQAGVRQGGWGWGTAFFDADNDGDLDLVMTNGVVYPDTRIEDHFNDDLMRYWENDGTGRFAEVSERAGLTDRGSGKGLVVFDHDRDGDLDILIVENGALPRLYRNDGGNARSYLRARLHGTRSTTEGLHAVVRLRATPDAPWQTREMGSPSHFLGQSERVAHFGLGGDVTRVAELEVTWPSGAATHLEDVPACQTLELTEPE